MKQKGQITAFYIETLIMITVMMGILMVLTQILGLSKQGNVQARQLTQAVTIAQSAAETASSVSDLEDFRKALNLEAFEVMKEENASQTCSGIYHWENDTAQGTAQSEAAPQTDYRIRISRTIEEGLRKDQIQVFPAQGSEEIYSLVALSAEP